MQVGQFKWFIWNLLKVLPHRKYPLFFGNEQIKNVYACYAFNNNDILKKVFWLVALYIVAFHRQKTSITKLTFYTVWQMNIYPCMKISHGKWKWMCYRHDEAHILKRAKGERYSRQYWTEEKKIARNKNINAQLMYNIWRLQSVLIQKIL